MVKKISDLTELAAADVVAADDFLAILDGSGTITKKISVASLLRGLAAGLVAAPALAFAADPDTGLYRIGADNLGAAVGGVLALDIKGDGVALPLQPAFSAYRASTLADQFGTGSYVTCIFETEERDSQGDYNPATGVFTARRTGWYVLSGSVSVDQLGAATRMELRAVATGQTQYIFYGAPGGVSGFVTRNVALMLRMQANDTVQLQCAIAGLAGATADLYGAAATTFWSRFAGYFLG